MALPRWTAKIVGSFHAPSRVRSRGLLRSVGRSRAAAPEIAPSALRALVTFEPPERRGLVSWSWAPRRPDTRARNRLVPPGTITVWSRRACRWSELESDAQRRHIARRCRRCGSGRRSPAFENVDVCRARWAAAADLEAADRVFLTSGGMVDAVDSDRGRCVPVEADREAAGPSRSRRGAGSRPGVPRLEPLCTWTTVATGRRGDRHGECRRRGCRRRRTRT